jgi:hypothetical protein
MSITGWYVIFGVGAAFIFVVVVVAVTLLQRASRIAGQLADVAGALTTISTDTAAVPALRQINNDAREMNKTLADVRQNLDRLLHGARP